METSMQSEKSAEENKVPEVKNKKKLFIIATILSALLIVSIIYFVNSANYENTDNAQLDADIIPIKPSVTGYIKIIHFKDNDQVKKGQLLITIDDTDLKTRVAQAEAALENSKSNLLSVQRNSNASNQNASASVQTSASVEQNINSAKARLTKSQEDFNRTENMYNAKAATKAQYDAAKADLEIYKAQYDGAVSQYKSASAQSQGVYSQAEAQKSQIALAEAMVKQREAELILAKIQMAHAFIEAPCDGIVTKRSVEEGQFITIAQPLCSIINNTNVWVTANFKETQITELQKGQEVKIVLDAFPDIKIKGKIGSFIGATGAKFSLLPPDNSTGNFVKIVQRIPVRIEITEFPKENASVLFPGLSAYVEVKIK